MNIPKKKKDEVIDYGMKIHNEAIELCRVVSDWVYTYPDTDWNMVFSMFMHLVGTDMFSLREIIGMQEQVKFDWLSSIEKTSQKFSNLMNEQ